MAARYRSRSPHGGNEDIIPLILEREQARLNKDFASADAIRERLTGIGVTVFDKTRSWKCNDGRSGRIPSWSEIEAGVGMESLAVEEGSAGNEDITQLVIEREQARLSKDFASADAIRDRLTAMGVTLFDKTNQWKSNDGRSGRIPTFTEIESGVGGENLAPGDNGGMGPINDSDDAMTAHIKGLVMQREQARAGKDFDRSDQLREELRSLGVEIFDKEKLWRAKTGQCGVVIGYSSTGVPTNVEITTLIAQREKARQNNDYAVGDMIRQELKSRGVSIFDKENTWRASDGRSGQIPGWDQIPVAGGVGGGVGGGHGGQGLGPPVVGQVTAAQLQAALTPLARPTPQALEAQNAVLRAALLAQSGGGPEPIRPSRGGRPPAQAPRAIGPPQRQSAELAEAVGFCQQAQASGRRASDAEIIWLVETREMMRQKNDYGSADTLRSAMKESLGIELYEKEKRWVTQDGRQGIIPLWQNQTGQ